MTYNLSLFTDVTKKVCSCCFIAIILIIIFIISPLSKFFTLSIIMRFVIIIILLYVVYLSFSQINLLQSFYESSPSPEITSNLNMNIISNYIFTVSIILLIFFIAKNIL